MASSFSSTPVSLPSLAEYYNVDPTLPDQYTRDLLVGSSLSLLVQKKLCTTDIERRIVLPKGEAEKNMPPIGEHERMNLKFYEVETSDIWHFTYRCYADNKHRKSYYLEDTGEYVKRHSLQTNDIVNIYQDDKGYLIIKTQKTRDAPRQPDIPEEFEAFESISADLTRKRPRHSELLSSWFQDDTSLQGNLNPAFLQEMMPLPSLDTDVPTHSSTSDEI